MKVYSPEEDYKLNKILMAARIYKREITYQQTDLQAKISKSFIEHYPQYCMPALETENGQFIFGVHTIMRYLAGPLQKQQKFMIIEHLSKIQKELDPAVGIIYVKSKGFNQISKQALQKARNIIAKYAKTVNDELLKHNTYLVGEHLSIADITLYYSLQAVQEQFQKEWDKLGNLKRWMSHIKSLKAQ